MKSRTRSLAKVSVVLPVLNEAAILPSLIARIMAQLTAAVPNWNIVLVNDGSTDESGRTMDELASRDGRLQVLHFARNFGHQAAVHAGLCHADGDAVIVMDSDGQDAPETLARMIDYWLEGDDVVYAVRFGRKESLPKRVLFSAFYRILSSMASFQIPRNAGNFGLMDRAVVDQIRRLGEYDRYLPGLRSWVGYQQRAMPVERLARHDKEPRVSIQGLISLAKTALFSFSRVPLHAFYFFALLSAVVALGCLAFCSVQWGFTGALSSHSLIVGSVAFFGSIQMLGIAIVGEYIARIYDQVRNRPLYIVARKVNANQSSIREPSEPDDQVEHLFTQIDDMQLELNALSDRSDAVAPSCSLDKAEQHKSESVKS